MTEFRNYTIIRLLLATGIRTSNILNMRIKDVNLEEGYIYLPKTKTGVITTLPLERNARIALKEYISYWRNVNEGDTEPDDYLFCNCYGEPLTRGGLTLRLLTIIKDMEQRKQVFTCLDIHLLKTGLQEAVIQFPSLSC